MEKSRHSENHGLYRRAADGAVDNTVWGCYGRRRYSGNAPGGSDSRPDQPGDGHNYGCLDSGSVSGSALCGGICCSTAGSGELLHPAPSEYQEDCSYGCYPWGIGYRICVRN